MVSANTGLNLNNLQSYSGTTFREITRLGEGEAGFVFSEQQGQLIFPLDGNSNGRKAINKIQENNFIDETEWQLSLSLKSGEYENELSSIGMHPDAKEGKDGYDQMRLPRFFGYLDATFQNQEYSYSYPYFSSDIVPSQAAYSWEFSLATNSERPTITISWDKQKIANQQLKEMYLEDLSTGRLINMGEQRNYLVKNEERTFKIYFGNNADLSQALQPTVLKVFELILYHSLSNLISRLHYLKVEK